MKTILIFSTLLLCSCNNKNQPLIPNKKPIPQERQVNQATQENQETTKLKELPPVTFDTKSFLSIPHHNAKTSIRNVLLNAFVEPNISKSGFKARIELDSSPMSASELKRYEEKELEFAKILVSHSSIAEVYFVPANIHLRDLPAKLGLTSETGKKLKWLNSDDDDVTVLGKSYFLVSLNHNDLIANDLLFYSKTIVLNENFNNAPLRLAVGSKVEVNVQYSYFQENVMVADPREVDGGCVEIICRCTIQEEIKSGVFSPAQIATLSDLNFLMAINGQWELVNESKVKSATNGSFSFEVNPNLLHTKEYDLQFMKNEASGISQRFNTHIITGMCYQPDTSHNGVLKRKANFSVTVNVLGRGENLRQIEL